MGVIKLVEDYSVTQLRKDVRDSLILAGEQAVLLQLFHAEADDAVPCPECGDDVYNSPEMDCRSCYGTMFQGGVAKAMRIWALFTDHQVSEELGQRGVFEPDHRSMQCEAFPTVTEHDVVARVRRWDTSGKPAELEGFYLLAKVDRRSLRTGSRFGQYRWDVVGQKAQIAELPESMHGITTYPIVGQAFEESIELTAPTPTTPASALVEPDVKVIYFPFSPEPGGPVADEPNQTFLGVTFTQTIPAPVWVIQHTLGYEPNVSVIVNGEEVDADIDFPNISVVTITFGIPVAGTARLT